MFKQTLKATTVQRSLVIALLILLSLSAGARQLVTYSIQYADPSQVAQAINSYLSAGSSVSVYENKLIVNATPAELAKIRSLLDQLDVRGRQLLISVKTSGSGQFRNQVNDLSGSVRVSRQKGVDVHTRVTVREYQSQGRSLGKQGVRATEGQPAYVSIGSSAPVNTSTTTIDGRRILSQEYISATSGFYATAWVDDGGVRVMIDQQRQQRDGVVIKGQQLQTQVNGKLGVWIPVGIISGEASHSTQSVGGRSSESDSGSETIYLKVELLES